MLWPLFWEHFPKKLSVEAGEKQALVEFLGAVGTHTDAKAAFQRVVEDDGDHKRLSVVELKRAFPAELSQDLVQRWVCP